jgi:HNH endonuclease
MPQPAHLLDRLATKVLIGDGCWEWIGAKNGAGYGRLAKPRVQGQPRTQTYAHRLMYELLVGPIPEGMELDHLCARWAGGLGPSCVRPDHLRPADRRMQLEHMVKDACVNGHPFDEVNTYIRKDNGKKMCRACVRERMHRYYLEGRVGWRKKNPKLVGADPEVYKNRGKGAT